VYLATVEQLADTAERMGRLVAGVKPEQWAAPTPCPEWDVQALVAHLINGNTVFAAALSGRPPTYRSLRADFDHSAETMLAAFAQPGALEKVVEVPFGRVPASIALHLRLTEYLAHGWDLARATGQPTDFPDAVVEQELSFTAGALAEIPPDRTPFAPARPVPDDAPPLDRLIARLGRSPR
jgi:uncharacterized protein (TIGR03086 family)